MNSATELEQLINGAPNSSEVKLNGKIELKISKNNKFYVGRQIVQGFIKIGRQQLTIDGANASIEVELDECINTDCCLFYVTPSAGKTRFVNLNLNIKVKNGHTSHWFYAFYNTAYGVSFENCHVNIYAEKQVMNLFV